MFSLYFHFRGIADALDALGLCQGSKKVSAVFFDPAANEPGPEGDVVALPLFLSVQLKNGDLGISGVSPSMVS